MIEKSWIDRSTDLLKKACSKFGIQASLTELDNYGAIFTRDAVMSGIAGLLLKDATIIEGLKDTLFQLNKLQGSQGQIASNFHAKDNQVTKVSFGTLSPKIDACTWYLIGVGLMLKGEHIQKEDYQDSVVSVINLLEGIEYNNSHLMYIPKGGNWADEYVYEGYVLYDQVLRVWGLQLLGDVFKNKLWSEKAKKITDRIITSFKSEKKKYYLSSIYPGGTFDRFDLAANVLLGIVCGSQVPEYDKILDWICDEFINNNKLPPAFHPTIDEEDPEWNNLRKYHLYDFKNKPHHYHNGGIWWIWLGWLSIALGSRNRIADVESLTKITKHCLSTTDSFEFNEYLSADTLTPSGTKNLCYTATGLVFLSLANEGDDFSILQK